MKALLTLLLFTQMTLVAQPRIKKALVEGDGTPMVMLAGGTGDISAFAIPAKELARDYKVVRIEHFNVQYATEKLRLPINYSVHMESEAVKNTLDTLRIQEPVILIGHSFGGLMALDFALDYPDRIRSLVLIEPTVFSLTNAKGESPEGMENMLALLKELTPQAEITETLVERFRCALSHCDTFDIRQHPQWSMWVKQKDRLRGLSAVRDYNINLNKLKGFKKPVLIITGTQTVAFHKRINELLAESFPVTRKVNIESGHSVPATAPSELVKTIREFIK